MAAGPWDAVLQMVFGRAFLLELRRGDVDSARVFARAFLAHAPPRSVTGAPERPGAVSQSP